MKALSPKVGSILFYGSTNPENSSCPDGYVPLNGGTYDLNDYQYKDEIKKVFAYNSSTKTFTVPSIGNSNFTGNGTFLKIDMSLDNSKIGVAHEGSTNVPAHLHTANAVDDVEMTISLTKDEYEILDKNNDDNGNASLSFATTSLGYSSGNKIHHGTGASIPFGLSCQSDADANIFNTAHA